MPFTNGVFKRAYSWVADKAAGLKMQPDRMDADANDIALGLSNALLRDGTGTPTADIPWGGKGITNLRAPANAGDVLSLGSTPATEVTRALAFQPVKGDVAGGHQVAISYDGTGLTASVDGNAGFGRVWTANTLGAAQLNAIANVGQLFGTTNLNPVRSGNNAIQYNWDGGSVRLVIDGGDQGRVYTDKILTAGQVGAILGYAPARPVTPFASATAGGSDLAPQDTVVASVTFTATAGSALIAAGASVQNNSSGTGSNTCAQYLDLYDNTAGGLAAQSPQELANISYGQGYSNLNSSLAVGSLSIGHSYTARLHMWKGSTASVTPTSTYAINGVNV